MDADPGVGKASAIPITAGTDINNASVSVNIAGLANGTHHLFIRTLNQEGNWSLTSNDVFATSLIHISADTILFGNVPVNSTLSKNLVITNNAGTTQTINSITTAAPFSTNFTGVLTLNTGQSATVQVNFRPANAIAYKDSVTIQTSAGNYKTLLTGNGIQQNISWNIDPATGHDYGTVQTGTPGSFDFTVRNNSNIAVVLDSVVTSDAAFVPAYTRGSSIAAGGSLSLPVVFTPSAIAGYTAQLKIKSSTAGLDSVTTTLTGTGFTPGTPPVLTYVAAAPYSNIRGVNAEAGQPGLYAYKIVYRSATNRAPQTGYPKLGIDQNGDQDFDDVNEGVYTMTKEGNSTDYVTGVTYSYTVSLADYSNTLGYRFFATDDLGNAATTVNTAYQSGPVITYQLLDLKIFANDISFSKPNPLPGEAFTVTANITNGSAFTATNVPVRFYRDTILLDSALVPIVNPFGTVSINKVFSFATDGYYPIKVWIDSSNTLGETNVLNNYAIRPIVVGKPALPGGINVTTTASLQPCPLAVLISGTAQYFGISSITAVAGAQVTITIGTTTFITTTNASGNYSFLVQNPACGGAMSYTVSITDFTLTSNTATGNINVPCTAPNTCNVTPQPGISLASTTAAPCDQTVGNTVRVDVIAKYKARNLNNFWNGWDQILKDTIKIYQNGNLIQTVWAVDGTTSPGDTKNIPVFVKLDTSGPNTITAIQSYVYDEFFDLPGLFYTGELEPIVNTGTVTLIAEANIPDLTVTDFTQTGFTAFTFSDANTRCAAAASHKVIISDSMPGGNRVILQTLSVSSLAGKTKKQLAFGDASLQIGTHFISITTDADQQVAELDETNNVFSTTIVVPKPDLAVSNIKPSSTAISVGSSLHFTATINNTGSRSGICKVAFLANGVQIGNKQLIGTIAEKGTLTVNSDPFTVSTADFECPVIIEAIADADGEIDESLENNNSNDLKLAADLSPALLPTDKGIAAGNPVVVRINSTEPLHPLIRNIGSRDISNVTVSYSLNGNVIGTDNIAFIKAGASFPAPGNLVHAFGTPGNYSIKVLTDTANSICEADETNNESSFFVKVVDANPDFEVLSQYISPTSLNPNPGQSVSLVGTVKNIGFKATQANVLRFLVDDIQLGDDVPLNTLQPGQDTTVAATAIYSSLLPGVKIMKIVVDPDSTQVEEREDNNIATRALIVGDAPDMARSKAGAISFMPSGFKKGDNVAVSYSVRNNGSAQATAWARFLIMDEGDALTAIDSVQFTLAGGASTIVSTQMQFDAVKGRVIAQIVNCSPTEFNLLNNDDTLAFSTIAMLHNNLVVPNNLDMDNALPDSLPGWIGGKLVLGDYDLTINGTVTGFDTAHFIVTNGSGRLKFINSNAVNIFPVGTSIFSPNFVQVNNTGTPDNFSVRVLPYVLNNGNNGDTIRTAYVNRTWLLEEETAGGSNAAVTFFWNRADELPGFDRNISRTAHFVNSWLLGDIGAAIADSLAQFSRSQSGYNSLSPFAVTSISEALPLQLLSFTATRQGNNALINWQTTAELHTSRFTVQHSTDGIRFTDLGTVAALNLPGINNYQYLHTGLGTGNHYYQLKMIDLDGQFTYSGIQLVKGEGSGVLQAFPNPAHQFINVRGMEVNGSLHLLGADGRLLQHFTTTGNSMQLNLDRLAGGIYIIQYENHGKQQQVKIMKE